MLIHRWGRYVVFAAGILAAAPLLLIGGCQSKTAPPISAPTITVGQQAMILDEPGVEAWQSRIAECEKTGQPDGFRKLAVELSSILPKLETELADSLASELSHAVETSEILSDTEAVFELRVVVNRALLTSYLPQSPEALSDLACRLQHPVNNYEIDGGHEWLSHRKSDVLLMIACWTKFRSLVDADFDPQSPRYEVPLHADVPDPNRKYPRGIPPEEIEEPELRKKYEEVLAQHRKLAEYRHTQFLVRRIEPRFRAKLEQYIEDAYSFSHAPFDGEELNLVLEKAGFDAPVRERIQKGARGQWEYKQTALPRK